MRRGAYRVQHRDTAILSDHEVYPAAVLFGRGVVGVIERLERQQRAHRRTTCQACGCLCLPGETCPGCRSGRTEPL